MKATHEVEETLLRYLHYSEQVLLSRIYRSTKPLHELQGLLSYWSTLKYSYDADVYARQALDIYTLGKVQGLTIETTLSKIETYRRKLLREHVHTEAGLWQPLYQCNVYCSEDEIKLRLLLKYIGCNYIRDLLLNFHSQYRRNRNIPTILPSSSGIQKSSGRIAPAA